MEVTFPPGTGPSPRKKFAVMSGRPHFDGDAEILKPRDESLGELGLVAPVEVVRAEVAIVDAVLEHVVGGGEHRGGDGDDGFLGGTPALEPQERGAEVAGLLA